jgi:hypothetical protein
MAEHNNELADRLPKTPNPALKQFERLIGTWRIRGSDVTGTGKCPIQMGRRAAIPIRLNGSDSE